MEDQGDRPPSYFSTPMLHGRLSALVVEMNVQSLPKSLRLNQLVEWVMHDLPTVAPDDPRTPRAIELARVLWERSRD